MEMCHEPGPGLGTYQLGGIPLGLGAASGGEHHDTPLGIMRIWASTIKDSSD